MFLKLRKLEGNVTDNPHVRTIITTKGTVTIELLNFSATLQMSTGMAESK